MTRNEALWMTYSRWHEVYHTGNFNPVYKKYCASCACCEYDILTQTTEDNCENCPMLNKWLGDKHCWIATKALISTEKSELRYYAKLVYLAVKREIDRLNNLYKH